MRKKQQCIGMWVVRARDAALLGQVHEIIPGEGGRRVEQICVQKKGFRTRYGTVGYQDVVVFGEHAVIVKDCTWHSSADINNPFTAARMLDMAGNEIGVLHDFCFLENSGRIRQLQMSKGAWEDLKRGRVMVHKYAWMEMGEEWVVWVNEEGDILEHTDQKPD